MARAVVLPRDQVELATKLAGGHDDGEIVGVVVRCRDHPGHVRRLDTRLAQGHSLGALAGDNRGLLHHGGGHGIRRHQHQVHAVLAQAPVEGAAQGGVAADDPAPGGRQPLLVGGIRVDAHPAVEAVRLRCLHGHDEAAGEGEVRIDDVIGAERGHVGTGLVVLGTRDHRQPGVEQLGGDGDVQVGVIVVGHRQHRPAARITEPRGQQVVREVGIAAEMRHERAQALHADPVELALVPVDHHRAPAPAGDFTHELRARVAVAADQCERLHQPGDAAAEAVPGDHALEHRIADDAHNGANRVEPADHQQVQTDHHPKALGLIEAGGQLAEPDGRGGVAHEVEGMEEVHAIGLAGGRGALDEHQPEHGDGVGDDQREQRRAHAPQYQRDDAVTRDIDQLRHGRRRVNAAC